MANTVVKANPYGGLNLADLDAFEDSLGCLLPAAYRTYLIRYNGGKYKKDLVRIPGENTETRVHHLYGLHAGPAYARLAVDKPEGIPREYLAICDDAFGNHFLIQLQGEGAGRIFFRDHESADLTLIADSFDQFVNTLASEDRFMSDFRRRDPTGFHEFQEQLREMKRLRAEEVKKGG